MLARGLVVPAKGQSSLLVLAIVLTRQNIKTSALLTKYTLRHDGVPAQWWRLHRRSRYV